MLPSAIASADVCLAGPFGNTPKAGRVVTGKTYQFLAMAKPTIVADTEPNRELLGPGHEGHFVSPDDPVALANAILELRIDLRKRERLAAEGHQRFMEAASQEVISMRLEEEIEKTLPQ